MANKKIISFEIPDSLRERLRTEAFYSSLSISALIRKLLEEALDQRESPHDK